MTPAMIRIIPVVETIRIQIIPAAETIQETTIPVQEILAMIRLEAEMNPAEMTLGEMLAAMGVPLFDESIQKVVDQFFDQIPEDLAPQTPK